MLHSLSNSANISNARQFSVNCCTTQDCSSVGMQQPILPLVRRTSCAYYLWLHASCIQLLSAAVCTCSDVASKQQQQCHAWVLAGQRVHHEAPFWYMFASRPAACRSQFSCIAASEAEAAAARESDPGFTSRASCCQLCVGAQTNLTAGSGCTPDCRHLCCRAGSANQ